MNFFEILLPTHFVTPLFHSTFLMKNCSCLSAKISKKNPEECDRLRKCLFKATYFVFHKIKISSSTYGVIWDLEGYCNVLIIANTPTCFYNSSYLACLRKGCTVAKFHFQSILGLAPLLPLN